MSSNMSPFTDVESNDKKMSSSSKSRKEQGLLIAVVILAIVLLAFVIAVIVLALKVAKPTPVQDEICTTAGCLSAALELFDSMNTTVDPCDDFYHFACGNWASTFSGFGTNKMISTAVKNMFETSDNIYTALNDEDIPPTVTQIARAYVICSQFEEFTEPVVAWLLGILQEAGGWPMTDRNWDENRYHWERNLAQALHTFAISTPIAVGVDINFFDTRKYIIQIYQQSIDDKQPYEKEKILSIAKKIGNRKDNNTLEKEFQEMEEFSDRLKKMSRLSNDLMDDPSEHKILTIKELNTFIPWINWLEFLRTVFGPYLNTPLYDSEPVILVGQTYISKFLEMAFKGNVSKRTLANFIAVSFIQELIKVNSIDTVKNSLLPSTDSIGGLLKLNPPQGFSESCLNFYSVQASFAIDFINHKYRKTENVDDKMVEFALNAMKDVIKKATWLDEATKLAALEKLAAIVHFSGFPDTAKDSQKVEEYYKDLGNITTNALRNQLEVEHHIERKFAELIGKNVDRNSWPKNVGLQGSQLNALNVPGVNAIVVPAGIQVKPLFAANRPKFWNYGSLGWVLGHEITHSFDTAGSKRDKHGNFKNWWMPKAKEEFEKRSKCFIEQYNKIDFGYENHHLNGTMTVGENIADNGGLHQAFLAYKQWEKENEKEKRLPGLEKYDTHQLFYISAAQPYCSTNMSPAEIYESSVNDPHSPGQYRFNGAAVNSEDFAKVFKCKSGTPMNPIKKCVIW